MLRQLKKGQSTAEYAIVIGLVIAAAVGMQLYVKRGIQGKIKDAVDYDGAKGKYGMGNTGQYEPDYLSSEMDSSRTAKESSEAFEGGGVKRTIIEDDVSTQTGKQTIWKPKGK